MVERRRFLTFLSHFVIIIGILIMMMPIYMAVIASTHTGAELLHAPLPLFPGHALLDNYKTVLMQGMTATGGVPIAPMMWHSLLMALSIAIGKIVLALMSAYAFVFFQFPGRNICFWLVFMTIMLPVEVRILPTFEVVASMHLLNSYAGLSLPLIASATATFLFRQFFMTIPAELAEAARLDGAGPIRFFIDILLPLSKTNISALFIIMFIYGWNQYLWPLVVTTQGNMNTIVMGIEQLANVADQIPQWHYIMATAVLAMLPPVIVVFAMQHLFEKGLLDVEK